MGKDYGGGNQKRQWRWKREKTTEVATTKIHNGGNEKTSQSWQQ